ncbi:MAG: amidase [Alphaproteobacteria bacterium]|nr:amidase [Alphaproteobacteria bacterium]
MSAAPRPADLDPLLRLSARAAIAALKARTIRPRDLIDAAAKRIDEVDPLLRALPTLCLSRAYRRAEELDHPDPAPPGYLYGLPIVVKDLIDVAGVRTTYGSRAFADHIPVRSDYEVERLEANGAVIIAKSNTPEFGAGAQTFNEVFGATLNPWNTALSPGGSSGGSAVALAVGAAWLANGTDLGGSLRIPASFTGVVGLRPSPGRVAAGPRPDPFDVLSVHGPMARSVGDCALLLDAQSGHDGRDPLSLGAPPEPFVQAVDRALRAGTLPSRFAGGCRIAWTPDLGLTPVDREVSDICAAAVRRLVGLGAIVSDDPPDFTGAEECFQTLRAAHFAEQHADKLVRYRNLLKPDVVWNIEKGIALSGPDIAEAVRTRGRLVARVAAFFEHHDFLALPTTIVPPFDHRLRHVESVGGRTFETYVSWLVLTFAITLTSAPALSLPVGFTRAGLPVGLQLVGPFHGEAPLLALAAILEADIGCQALLPIDPRPPVS